MSWLWLSLLGALVGLDSTAFLQIMFSRPIVAGALTGLILGRPGEGLMIGAVMEVFHLGILPIGAARYPEAGTGVVAATAAFLNVDAGAGRTSTLLLAVLFGLIWERLAGATVVLDRRLNERLLQGTEAPPNAARVLVHRHLAAVAVDGLRGATVSVLGALLGGFLLRLALPLWMWPQAISAGALTVAVAAVLTGALTVFGGWTERRHAFIIGLVCGWLILLFR